MKEKKIGDYIVLNYEKGWNIFKKVIKISELEIFCLFMIKYLVNIK